MSWHVRMREVRREGLGSLRWTFSVSTDDLETTAAADSTLNGKVYDLQSDGYSGTTGDDELDLLITEAVEDAVARHAINRQLDAAIERPSGRSDRLRWPR